MTIRCDSVLRSVLRKLSSILLVAGILGFAASASAVVTKTYPLTPDSSLLTTITTTHDYLIGTGGTPTWDAGYVGGHSEAVTLNSVTIEFSGGADDDAIEVGDTVTITSLNFYHAINGGLAGQFSITGQMDSTTSGAVGVLGASGVVTSWSSDLTTGEIHNELLCTDIVGLWCGAAGGLSLPESGVIDITHLDDGGMTSPFSISIAASPDAASLPMDFDNDYNDVSFEIEITSAFGRQYYIMQSQGNYAPALTPLGIGAVLTLMGVGIYRRRRS